jgi:hypothetical protein
MRVHFNEISVKGVKRWVDENGKKRQKTRKFYQTVNPFNKDADGNVKTPSQIIAEITSERDAWLSGDGVD